MHRAVLQACWPWFVCLLIAGGLAIVLVQFCGGRWQWRRWRELHSDQGGAVQSLSLVLTLPVFLMLVLFIVQISQMMVAVMIVHYAAFAGARAASVWIPADVTNDPTLFDDLTQIDLINDQLKGGPERANVILGNIPDPPMRAGIWQLDSGANTAAVSVKYQKVALAAIIPCLTISPSRDFSWGSQVPPDLAATYSALTKVYPQMDPPSRSNQRLPKRLMNKLAYSHKFTTVVIEWQEVQHPSKDVENSPTYNPRNHPLTPGQVPNWNINEVGFRDPVTVRVTHQFALLPGIGRILKTGLVMRGEDNWQNKGQNDNVASQITAQAQTQKDELYTISLVGEATFVNEGYKSMLRYAVQP
ncbi:MAG: hypothetical protein JWM11_2038 [Planctomycetaceae bacterium]|nr:hypothetical protein [Planctomycetaceae bacterium]